MTAYRVSCRVIPRLRSFSHALPRGNALSLRRIAGHPAAGFTLIELMIAIAIIGILAAFAYPSYSASVFKSRRAEGRVLLETVAAAQERYFTNRNKYTSSPTADGLAIPTQSEPGHFYSLARIELGADAQSFTLVAQPQAAQSGDPCASLTLESSGRRGTRSADATIADSCW